MSWIHIADLTRIIETVIDEPHWHGAVNAVAPGPERQDDFQRALARALHRPYLLRIPAAALRAGLGEMAQLLIEGQRVAPERLLRAGFEFRHFTLASALRDLVPDKLAPPRVRAADRDCEVWFNGDCPVCSYEIGSYARLVERRGLPMRFHDSMRVTKPLASYGLRREHLERRLYLRDEQGRIVSGFGAVLAIWARLPEYRRMASVFSWPPLRAVCETLYDHMVAPGLAYWARLRQPGARI
jgi:predicted DCC family thiol-disulfide oxidoreductase YuxK